jgi:hypothetical protein
MCPFVPEGKKAQVEAEERCNLPSAVVEARQCSCLTKQNTGAALQEIFGRLVFSLQSRNIPYVAYVLRTPQRICVQLDLGKDCRGYCRTHRGSLQHLPRGGILASLP